MLADFLQWMGLGLCHQLPERSFFGGGIQVPVCARDTGIYIGFVVSFLVIALVHKGERPRGFPRWHVWAFMGGLLLAMAWDGVSSYAALRQTTNAIRLFTGLGVGYSAAAIVFAMLQDELWVTPTGTRVLDPAWRFGVWIASIAACFALVWWAGPFIGVVYPVLVAGCIVATLTAINLAIVAMFPAFDRRAVSLSDLVVPVAIAVAVAFAEIALAGRLRVFVEGVARTL